jgi:GTP pyrophosphokinase
VTEERTQERTPPAADETVDEQVDEPVEKPVEKPAERLRTRRNQARAEERGEGTTTSPGPATTRSMRARLARVASRTQPGNPVLDSLFRAVRASHPKADLALLERAYTTAAEMHGTQMRKSGDPYITHPLAVTTILADIGMTEPTLVAALLHDTVEDTPYTLDELRAGFGGEVARRGDGVP